MKAGGLPYNLRINKHVDRGLFLDVIESVRSWNEPGQKYVYISMGGVYFEDHRAVHERFGISEMISIEKSARLKTRLEFNMPFPFIKIFRGSTKEFIDSFAKYKKKYSSYKFIIWLDYTSADRGEQLKEYSKLVSQLRTGDVIKITLNAQPESTKPESDNATIDKLFDLQKINIGQYWEDWEGGNLSKETFAEHLSRCVKRAANERIKAKNIFVLPIASFRYSDNQQMYTNTSIVIDTAFQKRIESDSIFMSWPFRCNPLDWQPVHEINVPHLSHREQIELLRIANAELSDINTVDMLKNQYKLGCNNKECISQIEHFFRYYRWYPKLAKVTF